MLLYDYKMIRPFPMYTVHSAMYTFVKVKPIQGLDSIYAMHLPFTTDGSHRQLRDDTRDVEEKVRQEESE